MLDRTDAEQQAEIERLAARWRLRALSIQECSATLSARFLRECADELEGKECAEPLSWFAHEQELATLRARLEDAEKDASGLSRAGPTASKPRCGVRSR